MRDLQPTGLSSGCCVTAQVIKPKAAKQACTHNLRPETMDQKYGRPRISSCRYRGKPTKVSMESANQTHIQPLASCIGERKVFEH